MRLAVTAALASALFASAPLAGSSTLTVPNVAEGNFNNVLPLSWNLFGLPATGRYQQVYAASEFTASGTDLQITKISFRADEQDSSLPFSAGYSSFEVHLSTTSKAVDGLSATFASNVGADDTIVFNGAITLGSPGSSGSGRPFDITITLTTPFHYHPANGNLLLDIRNGGVQSGSIPAIDMHWAGADCATTYCTLVPDGISRVWSPNSGGSSSSTTGNVDSIGVVTQFFFATTPVELQSFDVE